MCYTKTMNDLDYLNSISTAPVPTAPAQKSLIPEGFTSGPIFKILVGVIAFIFVMTIGLFIITATAPKEVTLDSELTRINLRSSSLIETINSYNGLVKSSNLRAAGSSLSIVLIELEEETSTSLSELYGINPNKDSTMSAEDEKIIDKTDTTLEKARLNGLLDRYYASEMAYQISHLIILLDVALSKSPNEDMSTYLESSLASLSQLQETFSKFSESD